MYAIIQARGRQLRVSPGEIVEVDGRPGDVGSELTFEQVLLVEKDAGEILRVPRLSPTPRCSASWTARLAVPRSGCSKKKRRKGFRKTRGHRAFFTRVKITEIQA